MSQGSLFTGQPVLSQLLQLIPKNLVDRLAKEHQADRYCKTLFTYDHLVTMLSAIYMGCTGLRELVTGLQACQQRLRHLGLKQNPRRSTLADANKRRTEALFEISSTAFTGATTGIPRTADGVRTVPWAACMCWTAPRSPLFSDVLQGTGAFGLNGRKKGGAKAHVVMRVDQQVPCFIDLTEGKRNDKHIMARVPLVGGSVVVFDMGYTNYAQWAAWDKQGVFWVTRLQEGAVVKDREHLPVNDAQRVAGVIAQQLVRLGAGKRSLAARVVHYHHKESGRIFRFVTNNTKWSPTTVARIYRQRWDIEMLFKRIKQNYPLRDFLGDSPNAIKIQIWCAFIADLLVTIVRDRAHLTGPRRWSFSGVASLLRIHLHTYIDVLRFLRDPDRALIDYKPPEPSPQLSLQLSL
ncbi:MAG: IS4 family transposase [Flavobacteriales bacterium]|nr:IS4 family transposase [Flavobacteriales bacterium]